MAADNAFLQTLIAQQLIAAQTALDLNREINALLQRSAKDSKRSAHQSNSTAVFCCRAERPTFTYIDRVEADDMDEPLLDGYSSESSRHNLKHRKTLKEFHSHEQKERVGHFFPHCEEIRKSVSEALQQQVYNVEAFYKDTGCCQYLAKNEYFHLAALAVIALNTVWIAIETDYNKFDVLSQAPEVFIIVDNLFCTFFFLELSIRLLAFKEKRAAFKDSWFVFDTFLVVFMAWETWVLPILYKCVGTNENMAKKTSLLRVFRLFRLIRVARAGRLLSSAPELMLLGKGIFAAVRSVIAVLTLLSLVIYIFAIIFTQLLSDMAVGKGRFENVPESLNTLMLQVLCGPDSDFINELLAAGTVYYVLILVFLFIALYTIMNMLIGILCGVVADVTESDKETAFLAEVEWQIQTLAQLIDKDGDGVIDEGEFALILKDPVLTQNFNDLGVDIVGAADFAQFIFAGVSELSFSDFTHLVSQFRGAKSASVKDIMDLRKFVAQELSSLTNMIKAEDAEIHEINDMVREQRQEAQQRQRKHQRSMDRGSKN